jgi:hypothetical protein
VAQGSGGEIDDGVELGLRGEVLEPGLAGELAAGWAGFNVRLQELRETANVLFRDAEEEGVPRHIGRQGVIVRDEDRGDAGLHDLKQANASGARAARTKDEVRGGQCFSIGALSLLAACLIEIPMAVGAGVFDEYVWPVEPEKVDALAEDGSAAALE